MSWTDDRVENLKKLWLEGHSASQIAKQLGGVTRNAVIGKVHRLGLSGRAAPSKPARPVTDFRTARPSRAQAPAVAAEAAPAAPTILRRCEPVTDADARQPVAPLAVPARPARVETPGSATVLTLGACMCKWPIGEPGSDSFTFCGARATQGPYCAVHAQMAYQPAAPKKTGRSPEAELARSLRRYI